MLNEKSNHQIIKLLLQHESDIFAENTDKQTPFSLALKITNLEDLKLLELFFSYITTNELYKKHFTSYLNNLKEKNQDEFSCLIEIINTRTGICNISKFNDVVSEITARGKEHPAYNRNRYFPSNAQKPVKLNPEVSIVSDNKLLEIDPTDESAYINKALTYQNLGQNEKALECCEKSLKINPKNVNTWFRKAKIFYTLRKYKETIECYHKLLEIDPNNKNALIGKSIILHILAKHEEAIIYCNKVLEMDPEHQKALITKGRALYRLEEYKEAVACCDKILQNNPLNIVTLQVKTDILYAQKKYELAFKYCDKILNFEPGNKHAYKRRADILTALTMFEPAILCYKKILELNKNNAHILNAIGLALLENEEYQEALNYFSTGKDVFLTNNKAIALFLLGKINAAEQLVKGILKSSEDTVGMYYYKNFAKSCLGLILYQRRNFKNAEKLFVESCKDISNQQRISIYLARAMGFAYLKKYKEAIDCIDVIFEIAPNNLRALYQQVRIFKQMGNTEKFDVYHKQLSQEQIKLKKRFVEIEKENINEHENYLKSGKIRRNTEQRVAQNQQKPIKQPTDKAVEKQKKLMIKNSTAFFSIKVNKNDTIKENVDSHSWYNAQDVHHLLKHYARKEFPDVDILAPLAANGYKNASEQLKQNLMEYEIRRRNAITKQNKFYDKYLVPLVIGKNHWVFIYIHTPLDLIKPTTIYYFNPKGGQIPSEISSVLQEEIFYKGTSLIKLLDRKDRVQNNDYDCGPWIVEGARMVCTTDSINDKNMQLARQEHDKVLDKSGSVQSKVALPPFQIGRVI